MHDQIFFSLTRSRVLLHIWFVNVFYLVTLCWRLELGEKNTKEGNILRNNMKCYKRLQNCTQHIQILLDRRVNTVSLCTLHVVWIATQYSLCVFHVLNLAVALQVC